MIKQVIVVRKDLKMRKGKFAAQVAHASMKVFFDRMEDEKIGGFFSSEEAYMTICDFTPEMEQWRKGIFTKIVVGCDDLIELHALYQNADSKGIPCAMIEDSGKTEFNEPTITCIAIGPDKAEKIDKITRHLELL